MFKITGLQMSHH